jgi:hypothetical protein
MDFEKMLHQTQDVQMNATWGGSIYALEELKRHIESKINHYKELQGKTEIGKKMKELENVK